MNTRELLLTAIRRDRAADLPRLVFADYIESDMDPPDPVRAEFVRTSVGVGIDNENGWTRSPHVHHPNASSFKLDLALADYWYGRGFLIAVRCPWEWWSANAAAILAEHPGLERVVLTTPPRTRRTPDSERRGVSKHVLDIADPKSEYFVSDREAQYLRGDISRLLHESLLRMEWGGDPAEGGWGVTFELPRPDAHGGQYRHWQQPTGVRRIDPIGAIIADIFDINEIGPTERILRDLLAEHGITEDDLRAGRREVTRLTTTDGRPPLIVRCNCQFADRVLQFDVRSEPDLMALRIETIQLRDRNWRVGGPPNWQSYRVADGICPRCNRLYFAVTRVEQ